MLEILLLVGLVVFVSHTIESVTGFGCTVLAFPFVIFLMDDLEQAKIILSILAWVLAAYFVVTKFKYIYWKQFGIIIMVAGLGMPVGMLIFKSFGAASLKKALGIFIVISAAIQLYKSIVHTRAGRTTRATAKALAWASTRAVTRATVKIARAIYRFFGYIFLFAGGIVHGAFAVGGPLVVLYSAKKIPDKGQFRATMCLLWTTLNTILMLQFMFERKLTLEIGRNLLVLIPFLIAGIIAGEAIHNKVNEALFKKIVFASLLLVGIVMVL
jgi:uncharacterized membrane protein YfcA